MTSSRANDSVLARDERDLLEHLQQHAEVSEHARHKVAGWAYPSVYHLLLEQGQFFTPAPRPAFIRQLPERLCYSNAARTAMLHQDKKLLYAEGFALLRYGDQPFPLPHGWCSTSDGTLIDPTWDEQTLPKAYFGIVFADPSLWPHDGGGILQDPDRYLPLLRDGLPPGAVASSGRPALDMPPRN